MWWCVHLFMDGGRLATGVLCDSSIFEGGFRRKNCRSNLRSEIYHQRDDVLHIHTLFKCEYASLASTAPWTTCKISAHQCASLTSTQIGKCVVAVGGSGHS